MEKIIGKQKEWKVKAQNLAELVGVEINVKTQSRNEILQILADAHIK